MSDDQFDFTPNLSLPFLLPAQAQKHVTVNQSLVIVDALVMASVNSTDQTSPPSDPGFGDAFLLPGGVSGEWSGRDGQLAVWVDDAWLFHIPREGWRDGTSKPVRSLSLMALSGEISPSVTTRFLNLG